jgi:hypothetical protein
MHSTWREHESIPPSKASAMDATGRIGRRPGDTGDRDERPPNWSGGAEMAKLIQICASQNDLFALDEEGEVHQYDFKRTVWVRLAPGRAEDAPSRLDERQPARNPPQSKGTLRS